MKKRVLLRDMNIIGKLHEISFYGLVSTIIVVVLKIASATSLLHSSIHPEGFKGIFLCYLFWCCVLFLPIALLGALDTKKNDNGRGLSFVSHNIIVIIFAHIGEEIYSLVLSPFWLIKDIIKKSFDKEKIFDYVTFFIEIIFTIIGFLFLLNIV